MSEFDSGFNTSALMSDLKKLAVIAVAAVCAVGAAVFLVVGAA